MRNRLHLILWSTLTSFGRVGKNCPVHIRSFVGASTKMQNNHSSADSKDPLNFTHSHWDRLGENLNIHRPAKENWWGIIERRYSEQWRFYHTLKHLQQMFQLYDQWKECIADLNTVALAIFFHDIMYDPTAKDNELQSIVIFKKFAQEAQLQEKMVSQVSDMIEATIAHKAKDTNDEDLCLFLDFDLAVLGQNTDVYQEYARNIRQEYIHYPDDDYRKGRTAVLKSLLEKPKLFAFKAMREDLEAQARRNMQEEIEKLSQGTVL